MVNGQMAISRTLWGQAAIMAVVLSLSGCVTTGRGAVVFSRGLQPGEYESIKKIVVEEAANNGFRELTSEVKPSEFNNWKGQLFFSLKTPNGTDQLFVEFERQASGVVMKMHGAGTRSNPDSAIKAISARVKPLSN
jgi:hypothetical protein